MTNAETISKLNAALNTLIKAYEELQVDNNGLKDRITELEDEVLDLEEKKEELELNKKDLEGQLSELDSKTKEDKSNIDSMLGKIESLLHTRKADDTNTNKAQNVKDRKIDSQKQTQTSSYDNKKYTNDALSSFDNLNLKLDDNTTSSKEESNDNKLDLNRMESLLKNFNS